MTRLILAVVVCAVAAFQLQYLITWPAVRVAEHGLFLDDAYFYSVLARNFARFGFLTFDGEMSTNGAQPLWMLLQILLVRLFPGADEARLLAASTWVGYLAFCFLAVWVASAGSRRRGLLTTIFVAGTTLLNVRYQAYTAQGVETPLVLALAMLVLLAIQRAEGATSAANRIPRGPVVRLALLGSLLFLARTDLFWAPLAIGAWLVTSRRADRRDLLLFGGLLALLVGPYLLYNAGTQHALMPISGRVKIFYNRLLFPTLGSYFHSEEWHAVVRAFTDPFPVLGRRIGVGVLATVLLFFGAQALAWFRSRRLHNRTGLRLLGLALLAHAIYMLLFYRVLRPVSAYYFAPAVIWCSLVLGGQLGELIPAARGPRRAWREAPETIALTLGAVVLIIAGWLQRDLRPQPYWEQRIRLVREIEPLLPPDARLAAFWPGTFAQFTRRLVTPLDGIVGSNEYFERYVKTGRELDYLLERGRPYLLTYLPAPPERFLSGETGWNPGWPWTRVGLQHLWQRSKELRIRSLYGCTIDRAGWYLLEIPPKASDEPAPAQ